MNFEVGKKYRRRDGGWAKYIGKCQSVVPYMFVFGGDPNEFVANVSSRGLYGTDFGTCQFDIVSDEPIKEPVEMIRTHRWEVVDDEGDGIELFTNRDDAIEWMEKSSRAFGIHELPEKILVTPK